MDEGAAATDDSAYGGCIREDDDNDIGEYDVWYSQYTWIHSFDWIHSFLLH